MRWAVRDIAAQVVEDGLVESIHYSSVCLILQQVDLQPHRTRYWIHSQDPEFEVKAASVLWYYEHAELLAREGVLVVCLDEKTGIQALGRKAPDILPAPGRPLLREFEYVRHGIVNLQLAMPVATGKLFGRVIPKNDSGNFIETLERLGSHYPDVRRFEMILDNGSSHTSGETKAWLKAHEDRFRAHYTPTHASWLDQAELALSAFSRRYLRGAVSSNRDDLANHIELGLEEYNRRYAHPFSWSFTRQKMHQWYERHMCRQTSSTVN